MHMSIGYMLNYGGGPVQAKLQNVLSLRPKFGFDCADRVCVVYALVLNHSTQMRGCMFEFQELLSKARSSEIAR